MQSSRDSSICERYLNENISIPRLAADVGLSEVRVRQILSAAGISKKDKVFDPEKEVDKTYSSRHVAIGKFVSHKRSFSLGVDRPWLANTLGWSASKLASVEKGTYNLTLIDMVDLATAFNTTPEALLALAAPTVAAPQADPENPGQSETT